MHPYTVDISTSFGIPLRVFTRIRPQNYLFTKLFNPSAVVTSFVLIMTFIAATTRASSLPRAA